MKFIAVVILIVTFLSCNSKKYYSDTPYKTKYELPDFVNKMSLDENFGLHKLKLDSVSYIVISDNQHQIYLIDLISKEIKKPIWNNYPKNADFVSIRILDDTLYLMDITNRQLYSYKISESKLEQIQLINFNNLVNWDKYFTYSLHNNKFEIFKDRLFLAYGNYNQKEFYLDANSYIEANLKDNNNFEYINFRLHQPKFYKDGGVYYAENYLVELNDSILVYGFGYSDSLYLYNRKRLRYEKSTEFNEYSNFSSYQQKKSLDLYYVRHHLQTNEYNSKILSNNGIIFVIKRNKKEKIKDPDKIEYYFLNSNLELISNNLFNFTPSLKYSTTFNKGFIVFDEKFKYAYYYEL